MRADDAAAAQDDRAVGAELAGRRELAAGLEPAVRTAGVDSIWHVVGRRIGIAGVGADRVIVLRLRPTGKDADARDEHVMRARGSEDCGAAGDVGRHEAAGVDDHVEMPAPQLGQVGLDRPVPSQRGDAGRWWSGSTAVEDGDVSAARLCCGNHRPAQEDGATDDEDVHPTLDHAGGCCVEARSRTA